MRTQLAIALAIAGLFFSAGTAAAAPNLTLDLNVACVHTEAWARRQLDQINPGVGLSEHYSGGWSISAGWYRNSFRRGSPYLLLGYTPLRIELPARWTIRAGITAGLVGGYTRQELPTPVMAAAEIRVIAPAGGWSLNLVGVPNRPGQGQTGFIGFQTSLPLR